MQPFRSEAERVVALSARERECILGADPSFLSIERAVYFDNHDLPCPVRVDVRTSNGPAAVVLRKARHGDVATEVAMFRALPAFGFPVPDVLHGPFEDEDGERAAVYSLLPGETLQKLGARSAKGLETAKSLVVEAVCKIANATEHVRASAVGAKLANRTLFVEMSDVKSAGNPWLNEAAYYAAVACLDGLLPSVSAPLVLSNGDYQAGNFLARNGKLTGFLDFERACFQDPLIGFVKYAIYDVRPLSRTDLVETFLRRAGFSGQDYQVRLALGCLQTLQREVPVKGGGRETRRYRDRVLALLAQAIPLAI